MAAKATPKKRTARKAEPVEKPKPAARPRKPAQRQRGAGGKGSVSTRDAREAVLARKCLELRAAGKTYQKIADELGIDRGTVFRYVNRAMDLMYIEGARALQIIQVERYHELLDTEWDAAIDRNADAHYSAVNVVLRVIDGLNKLLNLDKVDATQPAGNDADIVGRSDTIVIGLTKEEYFDALAKAHAARRALEDEQMALESTQPLMTNFDDDDEVEEAEIVEEDLT